MPLQLFLIAVACRLPPNRPPSHHHAAHLGPTCTHMPTRTSKSCLHAYTHTSSSSSRSASMSSKCHGCCSLASTKFSSSPLFSSSMKNKHAQAKSFFQHAHTQMCITQLLIVLIVVIVQIDTLRYNIDIAQQDMTHYHAIQYNTIDTIRIQYNTIQCNTMPMRYNTMPM